MYIRRGLKTFVYKRYVNRNATPVILPFVKILFVKSVFVLNCTLNHSKLLV